MRRLWAIFFLFSVAQAADAAASAEHWSAEKARQWYCKQAPIRGFNYVPRTAVNAVEMWQVETFDSKTIDQELGWGADAGYNSLRVFLQYVVWRADPSGLKGRMREFLRIADRYGFRTMFILFDDCRFGDQDPVLGKQPDPVPGVHNGCWMPSPGHKLVRDRSAYPQLKEYVTDVVGSFADDERVQIWDLYNEPSNSGMGHEAMPLVRACFRWAREANPSQPLTIGLWNGMSDEMNKLAAKESDVLSFHFYDEPSALLQNWSGLLADDRPVLCTEWLRRQVGNTFEKMLPLFEEYLIGWYHWGLVAGRTQTYHWWGSKPGTPEPKVWQHDVFRPEGTPYDRDELELLKKTANTRRQWRGCH